MFLSLDWKDAKYKKVVKTSQGSNARQWQNIVLLCILFFNARGTQACGYPQLVSVFNDLNKTFLREMLDTWNAKDVLCWDAERYISDLEL